jgi:hypothetical protein
MRTLGYTGDVMTANGFRSMASTLLNASSLTPRDKVRAAYNYAEHPPERRRMMHPLALEGRSQETRAGCLHC